MASVDTTEGFDRAAQEARLRRYLEDGKGAALLERTVVYGPWRPVDGPSSNDDECGHCQHPRKEHGPSGCTLCLYSFAALDPRHPFTADEDNS